MGMMGKGIALEFKKRFPQMYEDYRQKYFRHEVQIGKMDVYLEYAPVIINFPTKTHWKEKSSLEYIEQGLMDFAKNYRNWNIRSVAFPQLGCANGVELAGRGALDGQVPQTTGRSRCRDLRQ